MRTNNGNKRQDYGKKVEAEAAEYSSQRVKAQPDRNYTHTYDDNDEEYVDFQKEMAAMVSSDKDSLEKAKTVSSVATSSIASFFRLSPI